MKKTEREKKAMKRRGGRGKEANRKKLKQMQREKNKRVKKRLMIIDR